MGWKIVQMFILMEDPMVLQLLHSNTGNGASLNVLLYLSYGKQLFVGRSFCEWDAWAGIFGGDKIFAIKRYFVQNVEFIFKLKALMFAVPGYCILNIFKENDKNESIPQKTVFCLISWCNQIYFWNFIALKDLIWEVLFSGTQLCE